MPKADKFPLLIKEQSVTVKVYRQKAPTNASGWAYVVAWIGADGREKSTFSDLGAAKDEAARKAAQLAAGLAGAQHLSRSDVFELTEARALVAPLKVPLLSAVAEWAKARELAGPAILEACAAWSERRISTIKRIKIADAVDALISDKDSAKKKGSRTYAAKLKPAKVFFGPNTFLDSITAAHWSRYLGKFDDPVTRNDMRKRAVTLCRWAQRHGHLAEGVVPEIEKTERAKETARQIGILSPATYHRLLHFFRKEHSEHLAALVLAGLCGVRSDEIHGKRDSRDRRQIWEDIHLDRGFMSVSVAKENTPSSRIIHLSDAAMAWLKVCPGEHKGPVCERGAIEKVRAIATEAKYDLPENCFRHSWITYRIALSGDKHSTSTEAGNSVKEIDRRYRVPRPRSEGEAWFATRPDLPPS
jgi:hypothetical protein